MNFHKKMITLYNFHNKMCSSDVSYSNSVGSTYNFLDVLSGTNPMEFRALGLGTVH